LLDLKLNHASSQPLYGQLRDAIATAVRDGTVQPGDRLPSIRAISAGTGLAYATVSRAVHDLVQTGLLNANAGAGTRVAVQSPGAGNGVRTGGIGVAGLYSLLELERESPCFRDAFLWLQDEALRQNLAVTYDSWGTRPLPTLFGEGRSVDGIVVFASSGVRDEDVSALLATGCCVVALGGWLDHLPVSTVHSDNVFDTFNATLRLLEAGHRRLAFAGAAAIRSDMPDAARYTGFCQALTEYGIDPATAPRLPVTGAELGRALAARRPAPTALFLARGINSFPSALPHLYQNGIHLGRDLFVAAYDEHYTNVLTDLGVPFMRIRQPVEDIARAAVRQLLRQREKPTTPRPQRTRLRSHIEVFGQIPTLGPKG